VVAKVPAHLSLPPVARPTEEEFGLPFYPNALLDETSIQRVDMGAYYQLHASFASDDSAEKIAVFYGAKLKALAPHPGALVETREADKTTLMLKRDADNLSFVAIEPREGAAGSDIQLSATGATGTPHGAK
jgi:hypothetical protein